MSQKETLPNPTWRKIFVSVILLTRNAENTLPSLLNALQSQEADLPPEILILDSSSDDQTPEIARSRKIPLHRIDPETFSHSGTRNLGVSLAQGDYLVFITQDALPENRFWLEELLKPFRDHSTLAATYSRQVPKPGCNPLEARSVYLGAPDQDELRQLSLNSKGNRRHDLWHHIRFSNVSACYRADLLHNHPFDERLSMVEDQEWCRRMLEQGLAIYYCSKSIVRHSHNFGIRKNYRRAFEYGTAYRKFMLDSPPKKLSFIRTALWESLRDFFYISRSSMPIPGKIGWLLKSPFLRFAESYGFHRGWHHG